jgi:hypothetical protein
MALHHFFGWKNFFVKDHPMLTPPANDGARTQAGDDLLPIAVARASWLMPPVLVLQINPRTIGPVKRAGQFEFVAPLWLHPGADGWHFVSLPPEIGAEISDITAGIQRGFGSVRVAVTIGGTSWRTSIFPDGKTGTYLLPVKRAIRVTEQIEAGDEVRVQLHIADL